MFGFNCDKSNLYKTSVKFQYILPRIARKLLYFPLWTVNNLWFFPNPKAAFSLNFEIFIGIFLFPKIIILNSCGNILCDSSTNTT